MFLLLLLLACTSQAPKDCPVCPESPQPGATTASSAQLADWEAQLLAPAIEELRQGIQIAGEQPFGVCEGKRDCDRYVGPTPGMLDPGSFFVRAEVKVPSVGDGWKATYSVKCTSIDARGNTSEQDHEKTYDIKFTGKDRLYRLQPLWKIQSPHPGGARSCDFTLTPIRPDGQSGEAWTGHYETPAP